MDDRNELNDIMISENNQRLVSSKKILVFGAGGTVLFLVTIFVVYMLSRGGDSKPQTPTKQPQAELAQNALKPLEPQNLPSEQLPKEPVFEEVKVKDEPKQELKGQDKIEKALQEIKERNKQESGTKSSSGSTVQKETPKEQPKHEEPKAVKAEKPDIKQDFQGVSVQKSEAATIPKGLYVQVGAFFKFTPDKKFLDTIRNNNYQYQQLKTKSGDKDVVKVLIGPFMDDTEAKRALQKIREQINDKAFIVKG